MLTKQSITCCSKTRPGTRSRPRTMRPVLEYLETRLVPAPVSQTFYWIGAKSNDFSQAANWQLNGNLAAVLPTSIDTVVFNNQAKTSPTLTQRVMVGTFEMLNTFNKQFFLDMGVYTMTITGQAAA
jgi:hypothetical protein